jgi:predicted  nucleic acid-binding Zn-ribbon protein
MNQAEALHQLQEIDLNIIRTQKRLSEIAAALANNQAIVDAENQVTAVQKILTPLQTKVRNLELEIQSNNEKIRLTDEALYSGRVRNPKELQDMQQEIQSLKKRNSELEDVLLETMMDVEGAETQVQDCDARLQQLRANWENEHRQLLDEESNLKSDLHRFQMKREPALSNVEPESLKVYNTLRPRKNNQPVALLQNGSCSVCRVEQDRAVIAEARKGQKLITCTSCGRILVYRSG